jgi:capsular exopolysaccharide synthesis family protein
MRGRRSFTSGDALYVIFLHRTAVIVLFLAAVAAAYLYCLVTPHVYRAEATLVVGALRPHGPSIDDYRPLPYHNAMFLGERARGVRAEMDLLKGQYLAERTFIVLKDRMESAAWDRPFIQRLADEARRHGEECLYRLGLAPRPPARDRQAVIDLLHGLSVTSPEGDTISIVFEWTEPGFAALAANTYAEQLMALHEPPAPAGGNGQPDGGNRPSDMGRATAAGGRPDRLSVRGGENDTALRREMSYRVLADLPGQYNNAALDYQRAVARLRTIRVAARDRKAWIGTPEPGGGANGGRPGLRILDDLYAALGAERDRLARSFPSRQAEVRALDERIRGLRPQKADTLQSFTRIELSLLRHRLAGLKRRIAVEEGKLRDMISPAPATAWTEGEGEATGEGRRPDATRPEGLQPAFEPAALAASSVRLISPAVVPAAPGYPRKGRIMLFSALRGMALGLAFAAARERMVPTFRGYQDVRDALMAPLLLSVPSISAGGRRRPGVTVRRTAAPAPGAEFHPGRGGREDLLVGITSMHDHFYRVMWALITNPAARAEGRAGRLRPTGRRTEEAADKGPGKTAFAVAFAGCEPGAGASTMAFNFASAYAASSPGRVLLVDGNLREPALHRQFAVGETRGLAGLIEGNVEIEDAVREIVFRRYYFLQAGRPATNPVSIYGSSKFLSIMQKLRERYDVIIFDAPALLDHAETAMLSARMDGLVMVLRAGKTRRAEAEAAVRDLRATGAVLLGAVINRRRHPIPAAVYRLF